MVSFSSVSNNTVNKLHIWSLTFPSGGDSVPTVEIMSGFWSNE